MSPVFDVKVSVPTIVPPAGGMPGRPAVAERLDERRERALLVSAERDRENGRAPQGGRVERERAGLWRRSEVREDDLRRVRRRLDDSREEENRREKPCPRLEGRDERPVGIELVVHDRVGVEGGGAGDDRDRHEAVGRVRLEVREGELLEPARRKRHDDVRGRIAETRGVGHAKRQVSVARRARVLDGHVRAVRRALLQAAEGRARARVDEAERRDAEVHEARAPGRRARSERASSSAP